MRSEDSIVTDDFRIMTNRAFLAVKETNKKDFERALNYILTNLECREKEPYIEYLWLKLQAGGITNDK